MSFDPSDPVPLEHFDQLCDRILRGRKHPSFRHFLQGAPLFRDSLSADVDAFARQVLRILSSELDPGGRLLGAMARLTASHELVDFRAAALEFESTYAVAALDVFMRPEDAIGRCWFYAALCGDQEATKRVAELSALTPLPCAPLETAVRQLSGVLAWTRAAAGLTAIPSPWTKQTAQELLEAGKPLNDVVESIVVRSVQRRLLEEKEAAIEQSPFEELKFPVEALKPKTAEEPAGVVVFTSVGNPDTSEGKRVSHSLTPLVGARLELVPVPDLVRVRMTLENEFPHALAVIAAFLEPLEKTGVVRFRPTILVGPPGSGKSTFAIRLAELLNVPFEVFPCGGVSDSALSGTPRRWSSGEPSLPVSVIQSSRRANPLIVLDEVEKASTSRQNGALLDGLLGLWEPRIAQAWRDPYIEAACDLSHVNWISTANSIEAVPYAVRDRCRILRFPAPGPEHTRNIAFGLLCALENGDARWVLSLDETELSALQRAWTDGSIRSLRHMLEAVLEERERFSTRH